MIEKLMNTGDTGRLRIQDKTDGPDKVVELWVQSLSPVSIPQLPWTYSLDAVKANWKSFNFVNTTMWQRLGLVHVGTTTAKFTLHLGNTGTSQLNGPTDFTIDVYGYIPAEGEEPPPPEDPEAPTGPRYVHIKVGDVYKRAIPYVNVNGTWKTALAYVHGESGWKEIA